MIVEADLAPLLKHVGPDEIPSSEDLFDEPELERYLDSVGERYTVIGVGDIMLEVAPVPPCSANGLAYPFAATLPLLRRGQVVLGNLEGPSRSGPSGKSANTRTACIRAPRRRWRTPVSASSRSPTTIWSTAAAKASWRPSWRRTGGIARIGAG